MFRSVFTKTLYDKRWFIFGWSLGIMAMLGFTAAFFPTFRDSGLEKVMAQIPPALKNMMGEMSEYTTFPGYLASAVYGLRAQMLFVPLAIILGYSLGVSEEANRRLYQLLAQPVSRMSVVLQKFLAGTTIITIITLLSVAVIALIAPFVDELVPSELLVKIGIMSFLFTLAIFSVTYGIGLIFGRKSIALFLPLVWVMFSVLSDAFSGSVDWLKQADYASILHYYHTSTLAKQAIDMLDVAVLSGLVIVPILGALIAFPNRDLHEEA